MRDIYAVPEYVVKKFVPEVVIKNLIKMKSADSYGYTHNRPSVGDLAKDQGIKVYDVALPKDLVKDFKARTGFDPICNVVMNYDNNRSGELQGITREGIVAVGIYYHNVKTATLRDKESKRHDHGMVFGTEGK